MIKAKARARARLRVRAKAKVGVDMQGKFAKLNFRRFYLGFMYEWHSGPSANARARARERARARVRARARARPRAKMGADMHGKFAKLNFRWKLGAFRY